MADGATFVVRTENHVGQRALVVATKRRSPAAISGATPCGTVIGTPAMVTALSKLTNIKAPREPDGRSAPILLFS